MSKKKDRSWFVCPQWAELVSGQYASDAEAARALKTDPKVLAKLRSRTPVARSTALRAAACLCQPTRCRVANRRSRYRHEITLNAKVATRELVRMHRIFDIHSTKEEASRAFAR